MFCASEIAQLLCEGYAKTEAERAAQRQVCITAKALRERFPQEESMDLASRLEPSVLQMAREDWWPELRNDGWLYQDARLSVLGATPDAVIGDHEAPFAVVDCKISATKAQEDIKPKKDGSPSEASFANGCPLHYSLQLQSQMAVTGAREGWLVVLHTQYPPGMRLRRYKVERHPLVIERIRREVGTAWTEVQAIREGRAV
jgi:uncharacterized protein (DUF2267 family)